MIYGYARCSTNETLQDIDRQKRELMKMGVSDERYIYNEYESGSKTDRKQLNELLSVVKQGDTIVSTEVSRLSRSTKHLCEILDKVQSEKLCLQIGNFVADCTKDEIDPMTKGMLQMWAVFAEMEREMIRQRVISGIENAKAKGVRFGRKIFTKEDIPDAFYRYYPMYVSGEITLTALARILQCSRTTVYKYIDYAKRGKEDL